jgi:hypothetical protein
MMRPDIRPIGWKFAGEHESKESEKQSATTPSP